MSSVSTCIRGPYFFQGVQLPNRHNAQVIWRGATPGYVEFRLNGITGRDSSPKGNTYSYSFNMGTDLRYGENGERNRVEVRAVSASGVASEPYFIEHYGVRWPGWLDFLTTPRGVVECGGTTAKFSAGLTYPEPAATLLFEPPFFFPFIGGSRFGIDNTQFSAQAEIDSSGIGKLGLSGQTGFGVGNSSIGGKVAGSGTLQVVQSAGERELQLTQASASIGIFGEIYKEARLVDLICAGVTGGSCPFAPEEEDMPLPVASIIRWMNSLFGIKGAIQPEVGLTVPFASNPANGNRLEWTRGLTGAAGAKLVVSADLSPNQLVSATAYGGGGANIQAQFPPNPSYLDNATGSLFVGAKIVAFRYAVGGERVYEFQYSPNSVAASEITGSRTVSFTTWSPLPRDYLDAATPYAQFDVAQIRTAGATAATSEQLIVSNVFPEGTPVLAADESPLLLWVHDDANKAMMQGEEIAFSRYQGGQWSKPNFITNDRLQDFQPQLAFDSSGKAVAVWVRNKVQQNSSTPFDVAYTNAFEIAYATWNGSSWSAPALLTNNNVLDHSPQLVRNADGDLLLTWRQNSGGLLMGDSAHPDSLFYAIWDGTSWSTPASAVQNLAAISGFSAAYNDNGDIALLFSRDVDGDFSTLTDQEIFLSMWDGAKWQAPRRITNNSQIDLQPSIHYDSDGLPNLFWLRDGQLYGLLGTTVGEPKRVATDEGGMLLNYRVVQDFEQQMAILWTSYSVAGVDISYALYDPQSQGFSHPLQLTDDASMERSISSAFDLDGKLWSAYNKTAITQEDVTVSPELIIANVTKLGQTDLAVLQHQFGSDLTITDFRLIPPSTSGQEQPLLQVTIHNQGGVPISNPQVTFYRGDPNLGGTPIGTMNMPSTLLGGASDTLQLEWTMAGMAGTETVFAVVDEANLIAETDESNNRASFLMSGADLVVDWVTVDATGDGYLLKTAVRNAGQASSGNASLRFYWGEPERGRELALMTISDLDPGTSQTMQLTWIPSDQVSGLHVIYVVVDEEGAISEVDEANNSAWTGFDFQQSKNLYLPLVQK